MYRYTLDIGINVDIDISTDIGDTNIETYHKELDHEIMETEKSHNLPSTGWRPRRWAGQHKGLFFQKTGALMDIWVLRPGVL